MLSDSVDVTFHDCTLPDGSPLMETTELCELSAHCSQDEFLGVEVTVVAPVGTLDACFAADEQISLRADVIDGDGNSKNPLATQWRAADPGIASISHSGVVTGRGAGVTEIGATYLQFGKEYADTHPISVIDLDGTCPACGGQPPPRTAAPSTVPPPRMRMPVLSPVA